MTPRFKIWTLVGIGLLLVLGGAAFPVVLWRPFDVPVTELPDGFVRVSGVAHVHTTGSDGSGTVADVTAAARAAGLDFVIVTDHNNLAAKPMEGYSETGVLTIVGTELSNHEGHLLAVGLSAPPYRFSGDGLDALQDVSDLGGVTFTAHPTSPRQDLQWTGWDLPGDWGVEVLNGDSQLRAAGRAGWLRAALLYPLNPDYALLRLLQRPGALTQWDELLARRDASALVGADAHGTTSFLATYETIFRIAQNYALLDQPLSGDASRDIEAIVTALGRGRAYIGIGALAAADRFSFLAERDGERWTMGDSLASGAPVQLRVGGDLASGAAITLYHNGAVVTTTGAPLSATVSEPGVYRVEVYLPGWTFPWIVSNPIYVFDGAERRRRALSAALPDPVAADRAVTLDRFGPDSTFVAVGDESTVLLRPSADPSGGPDGSPAGRLAFRLGVPNAEHASPFAALISNHPRDLSGHEGLVFAVRSDDTYRLWVQVRDSNPRAPDGTESWVASVKTTTDWRDVVLPFSRLRSVDPDTDGAFDLADVRTIVFLVDIGALPPGTEGTFWFSDLGAY